MQPVPYLFFKNTCADAMRHYAETFGTGEPEIMRFSDAPGDVLKSMPCLDPNSVMRFVEGRGRRLYASDDPSSEAVSMAGNDIALSFPTVEEAKRVFDALADGGEASGDAGRCAPAESASGPEALPAPTQGRRLRPRRRVHERAVVTWCRAQGLEVTRSRAYRKNDRLG